MNPNEKIFKNVEVKVSIKKTEPNVELCPACHGIGRYQMKHDRSAPTIVTCGTCKGTGRVVAYIEEKTTQFFDETHVSKKTITTPYADFKFTKQFLKSFG